MHEQLATITIGFANDVHHIVHILGIAAPINFAMLVTYVLGGLHIFIDRMGLETVRSFKFKGVHIPEDVFCAQHL